MDIEKELTITAVCQFKNMGIKKDKSIDVSFIFPYDERANIIKAVLMVAQDVRVLAKLPHQKPLDLGYYKIYNLSMDRDGQTTLKLNTLLEYAKVDNVNEIVANEDTLLQLRLSASVIVEDEEE